MNFFKQLLNRRFKKVFNGFLLSYIIVILIPILLGGIAYYTVMNAMRTETEQVNLTVIKQIRVMMDEQFNDISSLISSVSLNPHIDQFLTVKPPISSEQNYKLGEIMKSLTQYKTINSAILLDYYIYFKNSQIIITNTSKTAPEMFYKNIYNYENISYAQWRNTILDAEDGERFIPARINSGTRADMGLILLQPLPSARTLAAQGMLVMHLNESYMRDLLREIDEISRSVITITDADGNVLFTNNDANGIGMAGAELAEPGIINYKGERWVVESTSSYSLIGNLDYNIYTPEYILNNKFNYLRNISIATIILILLAGGSLILFFSRRNYEPVRNLIRHIGFFGAESASNEYDYILDSIQGIVEEKKEITERLLHQNIFVRNHFFSDLLKGNIPSNVMYDDNEIFDCFQIAAIEYGGHIDVADIEGLEQTLQKYCDSDTVRCFCLDEQPLLVIIINFKLPDYRRDFFEGIFNTAVNVMHGASDMVMGVGKLQSSVDNIPRSYNQARRSLEYRMIYNNDRSIIFFEDIDIDKDSRYYYPIDTETKIINYINGGQSESAQALLREIIKENFSRRSLDIDVARCLIFDLISTVNKIIWDMEADLPEVFPEGHDIIPDMLACKTVHEMYGKISYIFGALTNYVRVHRKSNNERLKLRVEIYVNENFCSPSFSLAETADVMQVSLSYLSRFFKEQMGENFALYVTRKKLERAKILLAENQWAIKEVAAKSGYADVNNFIRTFKRFEGLTPGKYKEIISMSKNDDRE